MVCYCPLSVLSVPESILNEGQLHLAAIFQLSPRCHGKLFLGEPASKEEGGGSGRRGASAARGWGVRGGVRRAKGCGRGEGEKKNSTEQVCHTLPAPDKSAISQAPSILRQQILLCSASQLGLSRSSLGVGSEIIQFPSFSSTSFSPSSTSSTHPDAILRWALDL